MYFPMNQLKIARQIFKSRADRCSVVPDSSGGSHHSLEPQVTETSWLHTWKDSEKHKQHLCGPLMSLRYQMNTDSRQLQVRRMPDLKTGGEEVIIHTKRRTTQMRKGIKWSTEKDTIFKGDQILLQANVWPMGCCPSLIMDLTCCPPTLTLVKRHIITIPQTPRRAPPLTPNLGPVKLTWRHSAVGWCIHEPRSG